MSAAPRLVVVPSEPIAEYEAAGYEDLGGYYNPGRMFAEVVALSPREHGQREAHGLRIVGVPASRFGDALREIRPDLVRAYGGGWSAGLVCRHRLPEVPVLVSVHNVHPLAATRAVRYADLVLCVSPAVQARVRELGVDPARIRSLPNRVDTERFRPLFDHRLRQLLDARFGPGRHILHVGRRVEQKNADTVLRALASLPADYAAVFVGRGDARPYASLADALGVAARCFWVDAVPNSELPAWYSWCDVMCTPSRWEGFGIVFIEAAACGAAIVTSDIPPMNAYLRHDESACLVGAYEDPRALADGIRRVCEDPAYRHRLSQGAVKAAQPFDRRLVDATEAEIYHEALGPGRLCRPPLSLLERTDLASRDAGARLGAAVASLAHRRAPLMAPATLARWARRVRAAARHRPGPPPGTPAPQRALAWIRAHEAPDGGILVHSRRERAYPEVTGYLVPTLLNYGERELAARLVRWLMRVQRPDGAYTSPDGVPYVFDTGQALRGLLADPALVPGAAEAGRRAAEYLCRELADDGRGGFGPRYAGTIIPETIHLYVLPALHRAADLLGVPRYRGAANACLEHYTAHHDLLRMGTLTHFLAYELEALIDLGRPDLAAPLLRILRIEQRPDGAVRAVPDMGWVCTPGQAQLAICWYKTGDRATGDRALAWLESRQERSGGFRGSYGRRATYFPDVELSWAAKFYLDAHRLRNVEMGGDPYVGGL